jgi:peptidoglycan/LPS O-acetylase OafA/YrhL
MSPQLSSLTAARFLAALSIVLYHLHMLGISSGPSWYRTLAGAGYLGVGFFFVLSGFILVYTYAGREMRLIDFWQARFVRIYPAYLFSLAITAPGFYYIVLTYDVPSLAWIREHLLLASGLALLLLQSWLPGAATAWNSVAWSLSDEAFFYILFPFILRVLAGATRRGLAAAMLACWAMSLTLSTAYSILYPDSALTLTNESVGPWLNVLKFNPLARLPEFVLGCCAGLLFVRRTVNRNWGTLLALAGLAALGVVVISGPRIHHVVQETGLLTPAFAAIIYGLALRPGWIKPLEWRLFTALGNASYSLYLLHLVAMGIFFLPSPGMPMRYDSVPGILVFLAVVIGLSLLVYRFIEEPARRRLRSRKWGDARS